MRKLLLTLILICSLCSCRKEYVNPIIGTWELTLDESYSRHTSEWKVQDLGKVEIWEFQENNLVYFNGTSPKKWEIRNGTTLFLRKEANSAPTEIKIRECTSTKLVLEYIYIQRLTFRKL